MPAFTPALPWEVVQAIHRLRLPECTDDYLDFGGWLIQRIYEDEDRSRYEVVVSLVVTRIDISHRDTY